MKMNENNNEYVVATIGVCLTSFSGLVSAMASMALVHMIRSDKEKLLKQPSCRYVIMMSIIDIFQALAYIATSLPLPGGAAKETDLYWAIGNSATCVAQGLLIHFGGLAIPCYNASLCIWFFMSTVHSLSEDDYKASIEKWTHFVSLGLPLTVVVVSAALNEYHPRGSICWIAGIGTYAKLLIFISMGIVLICLLIIIFCVGSIYVSFHRREQVMKRYSISDSGFQWRPRSNEGKKTKDVAKQGFLFTFGIIITFAFPALNIFLYPDVSQHQTTPFLIPQSIFLPLQGLWNFIIYNRKAIIRVVDQYPQFQFHQVIWKLVFHPEEVQPIARRSFMINTRTLEHESSTKLSTMVQNLFDRRRKKKASTLLDIEEKEEETDAGERSKFNVRANILTAQRELEQKGFLDMVEEQRSCQNSDNHSDRLVSLRNLQILDSFPCSNDKHAKLTRSNLDSLPGSDDDPTDEVEKET